jgi:hypothetical protein
MFLGYPRSGHTLYGALLNAHPEAVIAHELDALFYVERGIGRNQLFALLLERDRWFTNSGSSWSGFSYVVPGQHQGRFEHLKVIGDKKGGISSMRLRRNPELLAKLRRTIGLPLRMFHIVRNPFDNISTMTRRNGKPIEQNIDLYFDMAATNARILQQCDPSETMMIRHEDFIARPEPYIRDMVEFVGLKPNERYVEDCAAITTRTPSRSREQVEWSHELIKNVECRISDHPFFSSYSFED